MAEITATLVKELREKTGAGMMDCKKALSQTDGDLDKAVDFLRTKGLADAAKKSGRIAAEGLVAAYVSPDGKSASIAEVNCETDFVAKTTDFIELCEDICKLIAEKKPADSDALLALQFDKYNNTVDKVLAEKVAKIGENIRVRRFAQYSLKEAGVIDTYIHMGGKIGVLVEVDGAGKADADLVRDIALHICAAAPLCVTDAEIDPAVLAHEKSIYTAKAEESGKPAAIIEKIVEGQIKKFKQESCLVSQNFVKNPDTTIAQLLGNKKVARFVRFQLGDGIEKRKDDFVEEVRKQAGL